MTSAVGSEFVLTAPFEARIRVGGEEVRGCLADLSLGLLSWCEPVRTPGVYQRQRHMPGRWFSSTTGGFLEYESLLERDWMLLMDFDREVEWICEQPLRLRYVKDGKPASHVPDLLAWPKGEAELCDVKSQERVDDPTFRAQVEATGLACADAGIGYRVLSEPDRQLLANVRWLAGFRERPPDPDGERARMLARSASGSCTIAELMSGAREPIRFALTRVEEQPAVRCHEEWRFGSVLLDAGALSDGQLCDAAELLAHLNEASFGYRSGDGGRPAPGEPRESFDPDRTTLRDRLEAKAAELGCSVETLRRRRRWVARRGLAGLVDARHTRSVTGPGVDERLRAAIIAEARELESASDVRKMQFRARVASRLARETGEPLELPSTRADVQPDRRRRVGVDGAVPIAGEEQAQRAGPRRVTCSDRWSLSGPGSSSRSTPRALMCSRSIRSRFSGWGWI